MKIIATLSIIALGSVLAACGSDKSDTAFRAPPQPAQQSQPQPQQWGSLMLENAAALPACSAERNGWLAYLKDQSVFQACDGAAWATVEIKGKDGKDGQDGKDGVAGAAGAAGKDGSNGTNGTDNKVISTKYCSTIFDHSGLAVILSLRLSKTSSGDVFARCSVVSPSFSVNNSEVWAFGTIGADMGSCDVHADVDSSDDFGLFSFQNDGAVYKPGVSSAASEIVAIPFTSEECMTGPQP